MNTILRNAFVALGGLLLCLPMAAQVSAPTSSVPLSYSGPETLSLFATVSTGTVAFPLGGGTAPGTVSINTTYTLNPGRVLTIEAGFEGFQALTNGTGDSIPVMGVSATFSSPTGTVRNWPDCSFPSSGATAIRFENSCGFITYPAITTGNTSGSHSDTLTLSLRPFDVAPGTYTGTLLVAAQAN